MQWENFKWTSHRKSNALIIMHLFAIVIRLMGWFVHGTTNGTSNTKRVPHTSFRNTKSKIKISPKYHSIVQTLNDDSIHFYSQSFELRQLSRFVLFWLKYDKNQPIKWIKNRIQFMHMPEYDWIFDTQDKVSCTINT